MPEEGRYSLMQSLYIISCVWFCSNTCASQALVHLRHRQLMDLRTRRLRFQLCRLFGLQLGHGHGLAILLALDLVHDLLDLCGVAGDHLRARCLACTRCARHDYAVCGCAAASQRAACDEGEHGLYHTSATPTRASLTPPPGTLLHTPSGAPISPLYARYWGVGHLGVKE